MNIVFYIFLLFLLFFWKNRANGCENSTVEETIKLLEQGYSQIRFSNETKEFVLVLGGTGMGKTPFTKWLTVNNSELIAKQEKTYGPFLMKDTDGKIGNSITTSATIFPDLYMSNGTAYYDFPGFRDTRCLSYGLATIYTIKEVVNSAQSVKILMLIDYDSVKLGGDRNGFTNLLKDMSTFIKDVPKFKDSISLIVTKVPLYMNGFKLSDSEYIDVIGEVLLQIKEELENSTNAYNLQKAITFIDIVTENNFSKIGLFRLPDQAGPFSEISILLEGKGRIEDIISSGMRFTRSNETDFFIPINDELKGNIKRLLDEIIGKSFIPELSSILEAIRSFYTKTMEIVRDISTLNVTVSAGIQSLTKITTVELIPFVDQLLNNVHVLEISTVSEQLINNVTMHMDHVKFLCKLYPQKLEAPPQFLVNIKNITQLITTDFERHIKMLAERSLNSIAKSLNEINEQLAKYHDSIENELIDLNELNDGMTRFSKNLTDIKFDGLQTFSWQISELFNMNLSILEFNIFSTYYLDDKSFNDLKSLAQTKVKFDRNEILKNFNCVKKFDDSSKWYKFLVSLYTHLSNNWNTIDLVKLLSQFSKTMDTTKRVKDITEVLTLINVLNMDNDLYETVKEIVVTPRKMRALESVINSTEIKSSCSGDTLTVHGYTVRISRVQEYACWSSAKNIEIFSFNKLYVDNDIDLTGRDVRIVIVAPMWNILGKRKINLNGTDGKSLSETTQNTDGDPGLPGGSGGHFFGIGDIFINGQNLTISSCGGNGGAGLPGKKGLDGIEGVSPKLNPSINGDDTERIKSLYSENIVEVKIFETITLLTEEIWRYIYDIHGIAAIPPRNGGEGGAGGVGGLTGEIQIVAVSQPHRITFKQKDGEKGANGKGGSGGVGKHDGKLLTLDYSFSYGVIGRRWLRDWHNYYDGKLHANGSNGVDGGNANNQEKSIKVESINLSLIVRNYKKHLREKLVDSAIVNKLQTFLESLNKNADIDDMSNGLSFVGEFQDLESQYYYFHQNLSFKPFLETLLYQIKRYSEKNIPENDKAALSILYPAIFGKIIAIDQQHGTIFDVLKYMGLVNKAIINFKEYSKQRNIKSYGQSYRDQMENKIRSATHLINTQLLPDIDGVIASIDKKIDDLLDELSKLRNKLEDDILKAIEKEKELQKYILARKY